MHPGKIEIYAEKIHYGKKYTLKKYTLEKIHGKNTLGKKRDFGKIQFVKNTELCFALHQTWQYLKWKKCTLEK